MAVTVTANNIERPDSIRNHALRESVHFVATGHPPGIEFCNYGEISPQGMNDSLIPTTKPPGEYRILVLGDSFVEARQVRREENFCKLLERQLATSQRRAVRVINAGVSSYSPLLCFLYFSRDLVKYQPDLVVLAFFSNDVFDDMRYTLAATFGPDGVPTAVQAGVPWINVDRGHATEQGLRDQQALRMSLDMEDSWMSRHFYVAALARHFLAVRRMKNRFDQLPHNDEFFILENDPDLAELQRVGWQLSQRYVGLLKSACDKAQARFVLTSVPIASQITGGSSYDHFFFRDKPSDADHVNVRRIAQELGTPYVDLVTPLKNAGSGLYFPSDGHWTPKGHRVAADAMQQTIAPIMTGR
ncbi:MAG: SGNH/GDSL hydrolase family protein [Planctomycetes bacterium]|nr:SGNH/GDSL hydrolase family protein [Planctomycetota bacterium]